MRALQRLPGRSRIRTTTRHVYSDQSDAMEIAERLLKYPDSTHHGVDERYRLI